MKIPSLNSCKKYLVVYKDNIHIKCQYEQNYNNKSFHPTSKGKLLMAFHPDLSSGARFNLAGGASCLAGGRHFLLRLNPSLSSANL